MGAVSVFTVKELPEPTPYRSRGWVGRVHTSYVSRKVKEGFKGVKFIPAYLKHYFMQT